METEILIDLEGITREKMVESRDIVSLGFCVICKCVHGLDTCRFQLVCVSQSRLPSYYYL